MNSILFAKPIKQDAFITILILSTQHSWYLATAIIKENQFYLASGMKSEELMIPDTIHTIRVIKFHFQFPHLSTLYLKFNESVDRQGNRKYN